ncbi:hypothetical protein B0H12DRAFT_1078893 [Mycena haematopus]|nr:hypothetical protein B0H12DRAFT_1078893 [Mycena haematopus]
MSLNNLSKPALEALLAFHADAARRIEEQLRATSPLIGHDVELPITEGTNTEEQSGVLRSPFNQSDSLRQASAPSPSPPSTPVRRSPRMPSPPSVGRTWPTWSRESTSPTPGPVSLSRKRRREEEDDSTEPEHTQRRINPGWPRGFIRTPPRRRRSWNKENEKDAF